MIPYLCLRLLPAWRSLSGPQRRFVWQQAVHPLLARWPVLAAKLVLALVFLDLAGRLGLIGDLLPTILTMTVTVGVLTDFVGLCLMARGRHKIAAYIQSHAPEIQSVA